MKKQTLYKCFICFFVAVVLVAVSYLISYNVAMGQFENRLAQYQAEKQFSDLTGADDGTKEDGLIIPDAEDTVETGSEAKSVVTSDTEYRLEVYDIPSDLLSEYILNPPAYLVGLNREGLIKYIEEYLTELPLDEFQMGLVAYDIITFSADKVVLRKSYDRTTVPYQYYLAADKGMVVVYYADQKTVYEYTGIEVSGLPAEEQKRLAYGIFLKDQEELYGLLEGFSS